MKFGEWLATQDKRRDAIGDLARAIVKDQKSGCMRDLPRTPYTLERHIVMRHAGRITDDHTAIAQAEFQWRESLGLALHDKWISYPDGGVR